MTRKTTSWLVVPLVVTVRVTSATWPTLGSVVRQAFRSVVVRRLRTSRRPRRQSVVPRAEIVHRVKTGDTVGAKKLLELHGKFTVLSAAIVSNLTMLKVKVDLEHEQPILVTRARLS